MKAKWTKDKINENWTRDEIKARSRVNFRLTGK